MTNAPAQSERDRRGDSREQPPKGAGFVRRALATLIDMAIFVALTAVLVLPASSAIEWHGAIQQFDRLARDVSDPGWMSHAAGIIGLWIALWWCFFGVGWGLLGATPGKWALGLRVVDHCNRYPIGVPRAMLRLCAYCVSSITCCWGHFLVLLRKDHRALHDILAGTRVVRKRDTMKRAHG